MTETALTTTKSQVPIVDGIIKPADFDGMWRIATMYASSGMVPKQYAGNPAAIIVAGQFGAELGLSLMPSLQNITVINGNPTVWGDIMLGIVRSSNTLEVFVEFYTGNRGADDYTAVCIAKRTGIGDKYDPADDLDTMRRKQLFVNEYSLADARQAGLLNKDNWKNNPRRMLKMRARSFTLRDGWPDKLKGMHSAEEMADAVEVVQMKAVQRSDDTTQFAAATNPMLTDADLAAQFDEQVKPDAAMNQWIEIMIGQRQGLNLEQCKSEIIRGNDVQRCQDAYRQHVAREAEKAKAAPETSNHNSMQPDASTAEDAPGGPAKKDEPQWDPLTSDIQQRYPADKAAILKAKAEELGIDVKGKLPKEVHQAICAAAQGLTKEDVARLGGQTTETDGPDTSENNGVDVGEQLRLELLEKYNQARTMPKLGAAANHAIRKTGKNPETVSELQTWLNYFETFAKTILGKAVDWDDPGQNVRQDAIDVEDDVPGFLEDEKM